MDDASADDATAKAPPHKAVWLGPGRGTIFVESGRDADEEPTGPQVNEARPRQKPRPPRTAEF